MKLPIVSIILPTYKHPILIKRAIESVKNQTFHDWELIVIDDGLEDISKKEVELLSGEDGRIILLKNSQNLGIQKSLNRGLKEAKGEYIARIDDDDAWIDNEKLQKQINFIKQNQEFVLVGTNAVISDENGQKLGVYDLPDADEKIRRRILVKNCFLHPSVLMRKEKVLEVGGYLEDDSVKHIEDYDLWLRLGVVGKFANLKDVAVNITVRPSSLTAKNRIAQARRIKDLSRKYKNIYPNFWLGQIVLFIRIAAFSFFAYMPIGPKFLYKIQKIYKNI